MTFLGLLLANDDRQATWPATTPFVEALGPLGKSSQVRVLALRTCKADVVVGLPERKDEELRGMEGGGGDTGARKWTWTGKWAVIEFHDGKS
jgi:damage-control phosphatase, subfamily III